FRKFVPAELVREILASGEHARLGGHHAQLTLFFSDIAGFTSIAESLPPTDLVEQLGEYLEGMTAQVRHEQGTVDKYIGDAVMAFWGAPRGRADHALVACRAALACRDRLRELCVEWAAQGRPLMHARIGLNTGSMLVGNFGSPSRLDYTAIGEQAHKAELLEALNKTYGSTIMISAATLTEVEGRVVVRPLDRVSIGHGAPEMVYELLGLTGETPPEQEQLAARFAEGLAAYLDQRFAEARTVFGALAVDYAADGPTRVLLDRLDAFDREPPPSDWDGVA
ncbi:MAG: adenylate/guanylate cyclase domain-containing protein, partial [Planctomycetota bacterium]